MLYNSFVENLVLPLGDLALKTDFIKELKFWRNTIDKMSSAELQNMQSERMEKLLQHAVENIPFYKRKEIKLTGNPYNDIKQFPVMYKQNIKENIADLYIGEKDKMVVERSSGSSGIQGEVYMTRKENVGYQAVQTYLWEWGGYKLGTPLLQTGITPERGTIKKIKDYLLQTLYVGSFNLKPDQVAQNLEDAKKRGCKYFGGYASSLNVHAEVAIKYGIDIKFDGVISWGDKLFDGYKSNINKAFHNPSIAEVYGTTEGTMVAGLCPQGNHHIMTPHIFLELLDKNGNEVKPGELGFVVVTRLDAFSFPLIRYYLGDLAIKQSEDAVCSCGKHFPMLKKIVGRDTDVVYTPNNSPLIVHFFTAIFEHQAAIRQFRILQKMKGEIEVEYIPTSDFKAEVLEKIAEIIFYKTNEIFPIKFIKVDFIPNTHSGKPQLVQNTVVSRSIASV